MVWVLLIGSVSQSAVVDGWLPGKMENQFPYSVYFVLFRIVLYCIG